MVNVHNASWLPHPSESECRYPVQTGRNALGVGTRFRRVVLTVNQQFTVRSYVNYKVKVAVGQMVEI